MVPNGISVQPANFSLGARTVTYTIVTSGIATQTAANEITVCQLMEHSIPIPHPASDTIDIVGDELRNAFQLHRY